MTSLVGTSELVLLCVIVVLFYVVQCICWVTPRSIVFTLGLRGQGKKRSGGYVWNTRDTAGLMGAPFPPLTPLVATQWPAFELTPECIQFPGQNGETVSIRWEDLKLIHSESQLKCSGWMVFKGGETQVLQYAALLGNLQVVQRQQRAQIIQDWQRKMMSPDAASRRVQLFTGRSLWLRIIANLQFAYFFVLLPLGFYHFGSMIWWRALLILLVLNITIVLEFWTLHKLLLPSAKEQRFMTAVIAGLSPMAAIRASDVVARDLLGGYHPLAAAAAILPEDEFSRFAGEQLRLVRFGDYSDKQFQAGLQKAMEQAIRKKKRDPQALLRPPEPESGCVVYCPRCLAQFNKTRDECSDCGYEALEGLSGKKSTTAKNAKFAKN